METRRSSKPDEMIHLPVSSITYRSEQLIEECDALCGILGGRGEEEAAICGRQCRAPFWFTSLQEITRPVSICPCPWYATLRRKLNFPSLPSRPPSFQPLFSRQSPGEKNASLVPFRPSNYFMLPWTRWNDQLERSKSVRTSLKIYMIKYWAVIGWNIGILINWLRLNNTWINNEKSGILIYGFIWIMNTTMFAWDFN